MPKAGIEKPDTEQMLAALKPFQRDTVEHVFRRMYTDPDCTRRFLVADEVGLGKTMVARGVIARAIEHLQDKIERIDIVYICSNADIARQNLQRLNLTGSREAAQVGRLTMLPAMLPQMDNRLNFVAFTPGTSFHMGNSTGKWQERALLYWMLEDLDLLPVSERGKVLGGGGPKLFQGGVNDLRDWKQRLRARYLPGIGYVEIEPDLLRRFGDAIDREAVQADSGGRSSLHDRIHEVCAALKGVPIRNTSDELWRRMQRIVGELRRVLANACLTALEPDLVILDEFQRFKELLDPENESGELAHRLFEFAEGDVSVRTLLLSATPYKMYTLHGEAEDDHYRDFMQTLRFLFNDDDEAGQVEALFKRMRRSLYRIPSAGPEEALECRSGVEQHLRKVMVRTERARASDSGDDMLMEVPDSQPALSRTDAGRYLALQRMIRSVNGPDMIEYWKSAPYLLNFMDDYKVKHLVRDALKVRGNESLTRELRRHQSLLLSEEAVTAYRAIDPGNARLRMLLEDVIRQGVWNMLWLPPSLPPYGLQGNYARVDPGRVTKRLIFSAWTVVPKTIAALVSYEIERRLHTRFDEQAENTQQARESMSRLLRLDVRDGRPIGLPLFTLLYPSSVLARVGREALLSASRDADGETPDLRSVLRHAREAIEQLLPAVVPGQLEGRTDEAWYWVAPILLDLEDDGENAWAWWAREDLAYEWTHDEREAYAEGWTEHLEHAWRIVQGQRPSGRAPEDLVELLARVAIAGPATSALRSLRSVSGHCAADTPVWLRDGAARIGWSYRRLFNQIETSVLIRGGYRSKTSQPYWRQILRYALEGGLTAVNDEYLHMLAESTAASRQAPEAACTRIVEAFEEGVALPASRVEWDEIGFENGDPELQRKRLRTHFAVRFGKAEGDDGSGVTREDQVRAAFNSPFWPFVLASTSVGQEGLDFHPYCHAIVHWNLPGNPVDMEQREGRIHRYKGHAVRKNLASRYSATGREAVDKDCWRSMFDRARDELPGHATGLIPDWIYPIDGGARIERHVPVLPFSRDTRKYEHLRRSLAAYRMVFGQARQEDLVAYLLEHVGPDRIEGLARELRIDLSPPRVEIR